jgi:histidine triad (HIT) family protein
MAYDPDNIFAKIIRGEIPSNRVLETKHSLAIWDINPQKKVHVLVLPKGAYENYFSFIENATDREIIDFAKALNTVVRDLGIASGNRMITNTGRHGGQEVPHYHVHVLGGEDVGPLVAS